MVIQYSQESIKHSPESDYQAEELSKRLKYTMANFAQIRFKHYVKMQMSLNENL